MPIVAEIDRIAPTRRPAGRPVGYQRWTDLLFVHWRVPAEELRPLIPAGLTVDTFDGSAWVGLVPFHMSGVRPAWFPSVPGVSAFHETNVRTYVHRGGADPGVWFFSLDAANPFACEFARRFFSLPYHEATMSVTRGGDEVAYESRRWRGAAAQSRIECRTTEPLGYAEPGTLEFFLVERYLLYSYRRERLYRGQVFHSPYPLHAVDDYAADTALPEADGLQARPFTHALFSKGVDVVAGRIEQIS